MYDSFLAGRSSVFRAAVVTVVSSTLAICPGGNLPARAEDFQSPSLVYKISGANDKLEITTNTSRILTLDKNIPRVQVNNPELLAVTPLSANQVQISAKKAGVTQVNLWDEDGNIHTVDILIYGDVRELEVALQTQFPNSTIKVYRYSESLVLKGFVDQPDHVSQITQLAADYAPKVINNITVGGVQQVLLKVKVMEVSRTKLRDLGVDWAVSNGSSILAASNVSGLLQPGGSVLGGGSLSKVGGPIGSGGQTFQFGVFKGNGAFLGFLNALQQCQAAKILAEPNIVAISGRPAQFQVGGEFPILIPQSLGTTSVEFKPYGTQVDFLPIVLGNGNIRLEVRPRISDIDPSLSVVLSGNNIPALTVRQVDTAVEMKAGQTFALGGLIQQRTESQNSGLPYLSDVPIVGVPFRRTRDKVNEIELLIVVTPEFVDAIEPCEVPQGGPGYATVSPENRDLYCGGHIEVPAECNPIRGLQACGDDCGAPGCGQPRCNSGCQNNAAGTIITDSNMLPGGTGYDNSSMPTLAEPHQMIEGPTEPDTMTLPTPAPRSLPMMPPQQQMHVQPLPAPTGAAARGPTTQRPVPPVFNMSRQAMRPTGVPQYTQPRQYSPQRNPVYVRNVTKPNNPNLADGGAESQPSDSGLIGPVGYDAQ
jgi:pilus assembly protein CpaC